MLYKKKSLVLEYNNIKFLWILAKQNCQFTEQLGQLEYIITHFKEKISSQEFLQEIQDYQNSKAVAQIHCQKDDDSNSSEKSSDISKSFSKSSEDDDKKGEDINNKENSIQLPRSLDMGIKRSRAYGNDGAAQQ